MDLVFRPATADDWPLAWEIEREAFRELVTRTWGGWSEETERKCAEEWDPGLTRMVECDGEVIGWVRVERHPDHDWLDLVTIAPRHQGQGLGTCVMLALIGEAEARGVPLRLSVYRTNPARRLYARLGFTEHPRDEIRVLMVRDPRSPG